MAVDGALIGCCLHTCIDWIALRRTKRSAAADATLTAYGRKMHLTRWGPAALGNVSPVFLTPWLAGLPGDLQFMVDDSKKTAHISPDCRALARERDARGSGFPDYLGTSMP